MLLRSRRSLWAALALVGAAVVSGPTPAAALVATAQAAAGQWDLSLADGSRQCLLTLRLGRDGDAQTVGMPAGCRRALPILSSVGGWSLPGADHLNLSDATGAPVLDFVAAGGDGFVAMGPQGESYRLTAVGPHAASGGFRSAAPGAPGFTALQIAATTRAGKPSPATTPTVRPSEVAGRYAVLRDGGRDTGCMVTLDDSTRVAGGFRAALAPACRDQGIVVFDPTAWQIVAGKMVLTAKRGHTTKLDHQPDGLWTKEPGDGKGLSLKKM